MDPFAPLPTPTADTLARWLADAVTQLRAAADETDTAPWGTRSRGGHVLRHLAAKRLELPRFLAAEWGRPPRRLPPPGDTLPDLAAGIWHPLVRDALGMPPTEPAPRFDGYLDPVTRWRDASHNAVRATSGDRAVSRRWARRAQDLAPFAAAHAAALAPHIDAALAAAADMLPNPATAPAAAGPPLPSFH